MSYQVAGAPSEVPATSPDSNGFFVSSFYFSLGGSITGQTTGIGSCNDHTCFYGLKVCATNDLGEKGCHIFTQAEIDHHLNGATEDEKRYHLKNNEGNGDNILL